MGAAVLLYEYFSERSSFSTGETDVWVESPTKQGKEMDKVCLFIRAGVDLFY